MLYNKGSRLERIGIAGIILATIIFITLWITGNFYPAMMGFYLPWLVLVMIGRSNRNRK